MHVVLKIQVKLPFKHIFYDQIGLAFGQRRKFYSRVEENCPNSALAFT